jgi:hypothetical protein
MTEYSVKLKRARKSSFPVKWHIEVSAGAEHPFEEGYRTVLFDGSLTRWGANRKIAKAIKNDKKPKIQYNYKLEA